MNATPSTRRVRFDRPGVKAIGPYLPATDYDVPAAEAERLVTVKGFRYVDGAGAEPAATNTKER
jgi:hypothetical protein